MHRWALCTEHFHGMQVHLLLHSKTHSFQVEWPDFVWTAGRQIEQRCNVEIDNIGPIEAADLVLNTQVSTAPTCGNSAAMHSPPGGEA